MCSSDLNTVFVVVVGVVGGVVGVGVMIAVGIVVGRKVIAVADFHTHLPAPTSATRIAAVETSAIVHNTVASGAAVVVVVAQ